MKIRKLDKVEREHVKRRMVARVSEADQILVFSRDLKAFAKYLEELGIDPGSYDKPYLFINPGSGRVAYFEDYFKEYKDVVELKEISPEIAWGMEVKEDDDGLYMIVEYFLNSIAYSVSLVADDILAFIDKHGVRRCKSWHSNTSNLVAPPSTGDG